MNPNHAIVDLAPVAVPLPRNARGMLAAFCRAGFVHATDRFGMSVVLSNDLLAAISQFLFIPLYRLEESLYRSWWLIALQCNGLGRLAVQIG
jgi:hypothetical protein